MSLRRNTNSVFCDYRTEPLRIRIDCIYISVTLHGTFGGRFEISQNVEKIFFCLEAHLLGHQEKYQAVQTQQIQTQEEVSLMSIFLCSHTHTHAHNRHWTGRGVKTERTGGIQVALAQGRRRDKGSVCPLSGSHRWLPNRRWTWSWKNRKCLFS